MYKLNEQLTCECGYCEKTVQATVKKDGIYSGKTGETTDALALICDECGDVIEILSMKESKQ